MAYGAVSYLRFINEAKEIHCSFVTAKTRLAHVKPMTVPRLELSAAVLAVKLDRTLREEIEISIDRSVFWTDSTVVLQYIRKENRKFQTFVANRLAVIHDGSKPSQWNFVDSNRNPADDASRGLTVEKLLSQDRWLQGPKFLWSEQTSWPIFPDPLAPISDQDPEIKRQVQANQVTKVSDVRMLDLMIQRYSSWYALKKGVAWILRFKDYIRRKTHFKGDPTVKLDVPNPPGELSLENLKSAERSIIGYVQKVSFPEVIDALRSSKSTRQEKVMLRNTGSLGSIYKLKPFLDKEGMLRVGGRLENAPLAYESKHQLLLPHNHHISKLLIMEHH